MALLVFDIETVPDLEAGRELYDLQGLNDADTAKAMFQLRIEKTGNNFLPHYLQKVIAISLVLRDAHHIKIWSLGDETADEKEIITRFFGGIDKHTPMLISWNGSGFDLPVLHFRALKHGISAPQYWESGEKEAAFRWNNYLNRFHYRHLDLMDVLAGYQNKAFAPLDEIASMLGFPGKMGMSGAHVWETYLKGDLSSIRNYCETDVLNTYCVYLRFELMRGLMSQTDYEKEMSLLKNVLQTEDKAHFKAFLAEIHDPIFTG